MSKIVYITPAFPTIKFSTINLLTLHEDVQLLRDIRNPVDIQSSLSLTPVNDVRAVLFLFKAENIEKSGALVKILEVYYKTKSIPFYWCSWNSIFASATLFTCVSQYGEEALSNNMDFIYCQEDQIVTSKIIKFNSHYLIKSLIYTPKHSIKEEMFKSCENLFITFLDVCGDMIEVTNVFRIVTNVLKTRSVKYMKNSVKSFTNKAIVCTVLHLLGQHFKYNVAQTGIFDYSLTLFNPDLRQPFANAFVAESLLSISSSELIPVTKKIVCFELFDIVTFVESAPHCTKENEHFKVTKLGTTVTFSVDKYFQPKLDIQKAATPRTNNTIILCLNEITLSIETIKDGKLKKTSHNNIPIAIGFIDGRILIGKEALIARDTHNSFILTDLIKFMKNDTPLFDSSWGFEVTKNENGQICLEFDTFRGRRKATPTFLFALIIRWAVKCMELSNGEKFETLVIVTKFLDDHLKKQLQMAATQAKLSINDVQIQRYKIVELNNDNV